MTDSLELKPIHKGAIAQALDMCERYRLLNNPEQAESICLDVIDLEPDNQRALVTLILAMSDQFALSGTSSRVLHARQYLARLEDQYQRVYYAGIIAERMARAYLGRGKSRIFAYDGFREAMQCFAEAEQLRPQGNDNAILRWNSCVRTIRTQQLRPTHDPEEALQLE